MPKPPRPEGAYFQKKDFQKKQKIAEEKREQSEKDEKKRLRDTHWHKCPECGHDMKEMAFKGSSMLKCLNCGGAFLSLDIAGQLCGEESSIVDSIIELFKFK